MCVSEVRARGPNYTKHVAALVVVLLTMTDSILCGASSSYYLVWRQLLTLATLTTAEILRSEGLTLAQSSRRVRHDMQSRHRRTLQLTIFSLHILGLALALY